MTGVPQAKASRSLLPLSPPPAPGQGLRASYFPNIGLWGQPVLLRDEAVDFILDAEFETQSREHSARAG